jgi:hypothetical protein
MLTHSYPSELYGHLSTSRPSSDSHKPTEWASERVDLGRHFKVPILGVQIGPDGERLVYRAHWPPTYGVCT